MKTKHVIFTGANEINPGYGNPNRLILGESYEVICEDARGYRLAGIEGIFDPHWFLPDVPVKFALGKYIPEVGKRYIGDLISIVGEISLRGMTTSIVQQVRPIGHKTYCVRTKNTIYIVRVTP